LKGEDETELRLVGSFQDVEVHQPLIQRCSAAKLVKNRCRLDFRQHFFFERVIDRWNSLEQCVIHSSCYCQCIQEWFTANAKQWASSRTNSSAWPY